MTQDLSAARVCRAPVENCRVPCGRGAQSTAADAGSRLEGMPEQCLDYT